MFTIHELKKISRYMDSIITFWSKTKQKCKPIHIDSCYMRSKWSESVNCSSFLTLCDPMDCSLLGSSVHGILQAKILEWVAMPSSGDLSNPGSEPSSSVSPVLQTDSSLFEPSRKPTHIPKTLENSFLWLAELWVIIICFLSCFLSLFSIGKVFPLWKENAILFWRTNGDPPNNLLLTPFQFLFWLIGRMSTGLCSSSVGSPFSLCQILSLVSRQQL